jgi:hypothetical protein
VVATPGAGGSASVSFTVPANNGSAITGYLAEAYQGSTEYAGQILAPSAVTVSGSTGTFTFDASGLGIPALVNGTAYTLVLYAANSVGLSPESAASSPMTEVSVPSVPIVNAGRKR